MTKICYEIENDIGFFNVSNIPGGERDPVPFYLGSQLRLLIDGEEALIIHDQIPEIIQQIKAETLGYGINFRWKK